MNDDLTEARAAGSKLFPEPGSHQLDARIFEAMDIVQVGVIQPRYEWFYGFANQSVMVTPSGLPVYLSLTRQFNPEAVAVHPSTLMSRRNLRQRLRRFKGKFSGQSCLHTPLVSGAQINLCICSWNLT